MFKYTTRKTAPKDMMTGKGYGYVQNFCLELSKVEDRYIVLDPWGKESKAYTKRIHCCVAQLKKAAKKLGFNWKIGYCDNSTKIVIDKEGLK